MKKFKEINDKNDPKMPLSLKNYILLLAGLIVIILGFVLMALISGFRSEEKVNIFCYIGFAILGLISCYTLGTIWFMGYFQYGLGKDMPLWTALTMTVFPFVVFDLIKVTLGVLSGVRIRRALIQAGFHLSLIHI